MKIDRGQVYYLNMNDSVGNEMPIGRPVLVLNNSYSIEKHGVAICACMTTVPQSGQGVVKVTFNGRDNFVLCYQIMTLDLSRLTNYKGELNGPDMYRVGGNLIWELKLNNNKEVMGRSCTKSGSDVDGVSDKFEQELYQKLYAKAMSDLVETRYALDELRNKKDEVKEKIVEKPVVVKETEYVEVPKEVVKIVEKIVEVPRELTEEEILEYIDKFFGNESEVAEVPPVEEVPVEEEPLVEESEEKKDRRKTHGMGKRPTREQINQFAKEGKVNINKEEWWVIAATTGMSENSARRIVRTRKQIGGFRTLKDLMKVDFVKASFIEKYGPMMEV